MYLYLCNLKSILYHKKESERIGTPSAQLLLELCPVDHTKDLYYTEGKHGRSLSRFAKRDINKCVNVVLETATHLQASFDWKKATPDSSYAYQPVIEFQFNDIKIAKIGSLNNAVMEELFNLFCKKNGNYPQKDNEGKKKEYLNWLGNQQDKKEKIEAYNKAYQKVNPYRSVDFDSTEVAFERYEFFNKTLFSFIKKENVVLNI